MEPPKIIPSKMKMFWTANLKKKKMDHPTKICFGPFPKKKELGLKKKKIRPPY